MSWDLYFHYKPCYYYYDTKLYDFSKIRQLYEHVYIHISYIYVMIKIRDDTYLYPRRVDKKIIKYIFNFKITFECVKVYIFRRKRCYFYSERIPEKLSV